MASAPDRVKFMEPWSLRGDLQTSLSYALQDSLMGKKSEHLLIVK